MLAPTTFVQLNGKRIAIDAYDVCSVQEVDDGVQILYMATNDADILTTSEEFDDVLTKLRDSRIKAMPRKPRDGDEWKYGHDDEDTF